MVYILGRSDNYENVSNDDGQTLLALRKYSSYMLLSYLCSTSAEFQEHYFDYLTVILLTSTLSLKERIIINIFD